MRVPLELVRRRPAWPRPGSPLAAGFERVIRRAQWAAGMAKKARSARARWWPAVFNAGRGPRAPPRPRQRPGSLCQRVRIHPPGTRALPHPLVSLIAIVDLVTLALERGKRRAWVEAAASCGSPATGSRAPTSGAGACALPVYDITALERSTSADYLTVRGSLSEAKLVALSHLHAHRHAQGGVEGPFIHESRCEHQPASDAAEDRLERPSLAMVEAGALVRGAKLVYAAGGDARAGWSSSTGRAT